MKQTETAVDAQTKLNRAVMYALKEGCFFPVPEPPKGATTRELIQWGAMRNLHDAIAEFNRADTRTSSPSAVWDEAIAVIKGEHCYSQDDYRAGCIDLEDALNALEKAKSASPPATGADKVATLTRERDALREALERTGRYIDDEKDLCWCKRRGGRHAEYCVAARRALTDHEARAALATPEDTEDK